MTEQPIKFTPVLQDVESARGLPNEHYTNNTVFDQEKQALLFGSWSGVGFAKDIPNPGDAMPVTFLGMPLILVRDQAGKINVFQNTCRHRGMILLDEPKNIKRVFRCPYHSWCYDLNGNLKTTPHVGGPGQNTHEEIKTEELSLFSIPSYVWHDVIFVNISAAAEPFEVVHKDLMERWKEFAQPYFHGGAESSFKLHVKTNWKLAVENYCESYHLPWIHPGLNSYSRLEDHYNIEKRELYSGQGTYVYQQLKNDSGNTLPDFEGLSEQWNSGAEYIAVYPNVLLGAHRDHLFSIVLEPKSTHETVEHIELYYAGQQQKDSANTPEQRTFFRENAKQWKSVFEEDIFVVEGMQRGRHGEFFDGGKFSPVMDSPTHNFHHWVATKLSAQNSHF